MENNSYFFIFLGILGAILGSFFASLADRICEKKPLFKGRSFCFSCGEKLHFIHLVPIFSYIFLRGKCAFCKSKIPFLAFFSEILGVVFVFLAFFWGENFKDFVLLSAFLFVFFLLSLIDFRLKLAPSLALWIAFFIALVLKFDPDEFLYFFVFEDFKEGFLRDALLFAGFIFLLKSFLQSLRNFQKKELEENLGDGDIIILAAIAGAFGLKFAFLTLFFASFLALPFFLLAYKNGQKELGFLPFIFIAFLLQFSFLTLKENL